MNQSAAPKPAATRLPRHDFILLPLLGLLTAFLLYESGNRIAAWAYSESKTKAEDCVTYRDASGDVRGRPNSVCWEKIPEGQWVEYHFNSSGFRSESNFGPKSPGVYRIVVIGSSFAMGTRVPIEKTFATLLPAELARATGRRIEIYNEGMVGAGGYPPVILKRFKGILKSEPDLILWVLTPWDIENLSNTSDHDEPDPNPRVKELWTKRVNAWLPSRMRSLGEWFVGAGMAFRASPLVLMLRHIIYLDDSQYVRAYLRQDEEVMGYLRATPGSELQEHLHKFDGFDADIESGLKPSGVPLVATLAPLRAQAIMISSGAWPSGIDPYKLGNEISAIIMSHGGVYLDMLPDFRTAPDVGQDYFPVEGHLSADGNRAIAGFLTKKLTDGTIPALKAVGVAQNAVGQEK